MSDSTEAGPACALLEQVLESTAEAVVACDVDGKLTLFNRAARELHDVDPSPVGSEEWSARYGLCTPDGERPLRPEEIPLARALQGERLRDVQCGVRRPDGELRLLSWSGGPLEGTAGEPLGAMVSGRDLTDQERERLRLQRLVDRMESSLRGRQVGTFTFDIPKQTLEAGASARSMLGLDAIPEDQRPTTLEGWIDLLHPPEFREKMKGQIQEIVAGRSTSFDGKYLMRSAGGSWAWRLGFTEVSAWSDGVARELSVSIVDVDELERECRRASWREKLLEQSRGLHLRWRSDGHGERRMDVTVLRTFLEATRSTEGLFVEVLPGPADEFVMLAVTQDGEPQRVESRPRYPRSGSWMERCCVDPEDLWCRPVGQHEVLDHFSPELRDGVICLDIGSGDEPLGAVLLAGAPTGYGEAPQEDLEPLLTSTEALLRMRRSEVRQRLLEQAIENLDESVAITDRKGLLVYVNPAMERLSGYSREELLGQNPRVLKGGALDEEDYSELWRLIQAGQSWTGRFVNKRKDGRTWTEVATISPLLRDGAPTHFVKVARDVTAELEAEKGLRQRQKLAAIGTLSGGISHEFNNVLGMIVGYLELAQDDLAPDSQAAKDLDRALGAADRGAELVRQLLAFSRITEGTPHLVELEVLVKEVVKMMRSGIPRRIELESELTAEGFQSQVDPSQFRQLLVNLVTNASQAIGEGTGTIRIRLRGLADRVELVVADDGPGASAEVAERVFEPFFTTRDPAIFSGMGLAVVHGIVSQLGGEVAFASVPGEGTTVSVNLPAKAPTEAVASTRSGGGVPLAGRALIVDDEGDLVRILSRLLGSRGMDVVGFRDSAAAARALEQDAEVFDILVTDLTMPQRTGDSLARLFREKRPGAPVLLVTGYDASSDHRVDDPVFDRVLRKPVRSEELAAAVAELLGSREP